MTTPASLDWVVFVDLGLDETYKVRLRGFEYADARARGLTLARAAAVERHAPTSRPDVYVVTASDPSAAVFLDHLDQTLACCPCAEREHHVGPTADGATGRWCRGTRMSGGAFGMAQRCGCYRLVKPAPAGT